MPHRPREPICPRDPLLLTLRVGSWVGNLRDRRRFRAVRAALLAGARRNGLRVIHFSVQCDHLHLLAELAEGHDLGRAMKGLQVRVARAVNRALRRKGRVFADRYHVRPLRSPRQVRNALVYVLNNRRKHAAQERTQITWALDPCSSAAAFDGWATRPRCDDVELERALPPPRTWLLSVGWRQRGLIPMDAVPGPGGGAAESRVPSEIGDQSPRPRAT